MRGNTLCNVLVLLLLHIDTSSCEFCYTLEESYKTVKTTCSEIVDLGWIGPLEIPVTCYKQRLVSTTVKKCCEGWIGDSCNISINLFTTPEPNCKLFSTEPPQTKETPPNFVPAITEISAFLNKTTVKGRKRDYPMYDVILMCGFPHSTEEEYLYRVTWYQDGCKMFITDYGIDKNDSNLMLTEAQFVENGFHLGSTLSCDVRAYNRSSGPPGGASNRSPDYFVGLELLDRVLIFDAGDTGVIKLRPTIPIGCKYEDTCEITLKATIPDKEVHGKCSGLAIEGRRCGINLQSENPLDTVYEIKVTPVENGQYKTEEGYYEIFLQTQPSPDQELWQNYSLPKIQVYVQGQTGSIVYGKRCHSDNDPHMKSFDGRYYEMQQVNAVYTLYQHKERDAEIQIRLKRCNSDQALCNCGIAARVGQDVYKMDFCDTNDMFMNYLSCGDNALKVKSNKELKYKILLSYGTYAEVDVQYIYGSIFLGIRIQPSTQDSYGLSSGLCGPLDDDTQNDFQLPDGSTGSDELTFTNSWRVLEDTRNMFSELFDKEELIPMSYQVCVCRNATEQENGDPTVHPLSCNTNAVATCVKGKDTSAESCAPITRFRRSIKRNPTVPRVKANANYLTSKRRKRETSETVWSKEAAEAFCDQYIRQSQVFQLCSQIPNVRTDEAIYNCALDLQILQDTEWASVSMEGMRSTCLAELYRNATLHETHENETTSIADEIENISCINNCSFAGECEKGECKCQAGYGGCDCSSDLNQAPLLEGLLDDGLCDERELECSTAYVFGHFFTDSDTLSCKLSRFEISQEGISQERGETIVAAEFDSFIEVKCPIPERRRKRWFVNEPGFIYGYTVSVSNDGTHYGEGKDIYVFNSECQSPKWNNGKVEFVMANDFCFIKGFCILGGTMDTSDNCSLCDPTQNKFGWSVNQNHSDCLYEQFNSEEGPGTQRYLIIIPIILGVVVVAVAVSVVLFIRFSKRSNQKVNVISIRSKAISRQNTSASLTMVEDLGFGIWPVELNEHYPKFKPPASLKTENKPDGDS